MKRRSKKAPIVGRLSRAWTSVPVDIMEERALSTTARLVLAYLIGLATRPGWIIYVGQVRAALGLGEYAWTQARKQLEQAGYYWSERLKEDDGTWVWVHVVTDVPGSPESRAGHGDHPPNPSIPGKPGDGSPGHGKPGDIRSKKVRTHKKCTTTTESASPSGELIHPRGLAEAEVVVVDELIAELPASQRQAVLDELAGAMAKPGRIKTTAVAFLLSLVQRAKRGEFHPSLGIQVATARQRRATQAKAEAEERVERERRRQAVDSEENRRVAEAELAQLSKQLGISPRSSMTGGD